jgi:hypothetical protein
MEKSCQSSSPGTRTELEFDVPIKLELDIIEEDNREEIEAFVRLSRFGRFEEAERLFNKTLAHMILFPVEHPNLFPVVAEWADLLQEQGRYLELNKFLATFLDKPITKETFESSAIRLLSLVKALSEIYTKGLLQSALDLARHTIQQVPATAESNPTDVEVRI